MIKKVLLTTALASTLGGIWSTSALAAGRDYISIVGSSTVYPFATVVAERYGRVSGFKTPKIESTGSGGGMKLFCTGVGVNTPDVTNASRRIKYSEYEKCQKNGVTDIIEVLIGFDGIAVANSVNAQQLSLTRKDLFLALAAKVPSPEGSEKLVPNPYVFWSDVNADLPKIAIEVLGPPPTSGTRDAFLELVMEAGCESFPFIESMEKAEFKETCHSIREDGRYIDAGENDNLIVQKLAANEDALGIFGFSFLEQNDDVVQSSLIEGVEAEFDAIADGDYPISRPLYFYVKAQHVGVIPGIEEYLAEFTNESTWGEDGYLADKGMIPLGDEARGKVKADVDAMNGLVMTE